MPHAAFWPLLDDDSRQELLRIGRAAHFAQGEVILHQYEESDHLLVIHNGCVKVLVESGAGYRAVLAIRGAGDLVGEQAGIDGGSRSATLQALTEVDARILPLKGFNAAQRAHPAIARALQHVLSDRLREADRHRSAAGAEAVQPRLAALLLELSERYGEPTDNGEVRITLPLTQDDLAGLVLSSRRTVSRILEQWRDQGWVLTGRFLIRLRVDVLRDLLAVEWAPDQSAVMRRPDRRSDARPGRRIRQ